MTRFLLIFTLLLFLPSSFLAKELKKVTLQLSWFDQFQFAGYYIAKEKGYFKEYGLDVDIKPFEFGVNVSSEVDEKRVDFAVDRETLILQRTSGKKLVALYALFQESPLVLLSKKESNINEIKDFYNKKIMTTIDDAGEVSIKSMIVSKGLKIEDLSFVKHSHDILDLVNNKTDVISAYLSKTPYDLNKMGVKFNIFSPTDYGFDMYSDFLFTHEDMIKDDLPTVLAFKEASLKGWEYAYSNIDETADFLFRNFNSQNIPLDALIFEGNILKELSYSNTNKLGEIKPEKIQRIYDLYNVMGLTPKKIDLNKFVLYKEISEKINFSTREKSYIHNKKEVTMCVLPDIKPYSFIENGESNGMFSEFIKLIAKKSELDLKLIRTKNFKESLDFINSGKCEVIPSIQNIKSRKKDINFTEPYINVSLALVTRNGSEFIDDITILKNKKIGLPKNFSYNKILKDKYLNHNFIDVENLDEGLKKVEENEIFAYIDLLHPLLNKIRYEYLGKLKISGKLDSTIPVSIGITKKDPLLHSIFNKSVMSIPKKELDSIVEKWTTIEYKKEFDYDTLFKVGLVFLIIIIAVVYKQIVLRNMNRVLQQKIDEKTLALQQINHNLEEKVKKEVSNNLRKDALLTKQSKMAAMGEMIQNIAHQWRQPLSVISTGASGLKLQKDVNGKVDDKLMEDTLTTIVDTSLQLSTTIDDFMHFFKPSNEIKVFSVDDLILKTLNIFDYELQNEKIKVIKDIQKIKVIGYESELIQVLANLLTNSKDAFSINKTKNKLIFLSTRTEGDYIFIELKDNAGGIDDMIINKIFEPYFTTKHQYQGTGIGLYMCQEIIDKHMDGSIDVKNVEYSYEGKNCKGAMFIIKLKIK